MFGRGLLAWTLNGAIARWNNESSAKVMFFCGLKPQIVAVAVFCGIVNYGVLLLLLFAFDFYISFADAFGIFFSFFTVFTIAFARILNRTDGPVSRAELGGSLLTLSGVVLISQPSWLFAAVGAHALDPMGVAVSVLAGIGCGAYNTLCRYLTVQGLTAATINSAAMLTIGAMAGLALALCTVVRGVEAVPRWAVITLPTSAWAWAFLLSYCTLITIAQLLFIGAVKHLRASTAGILSSTELIFASLLGALMLRQPTNGLAVLGNVIVFAGSGAVAVAAAREMTPPTVQKPDAERGTRRTAAAAGLGEEAATELQDAELDEFESPAAMVQQAGGNGTQKMMWLKGRPAVQQ